MGFWNRLFGTEDEPTGKHAAADPQEAAATQQPAQDQPVERSAEAKFFAALPTEDEPARYDGPSTAETMPAMPAQPSPTDTEDPAVGSPIAGMSVDEAGDALTAAEPAHQPVLDSAEEHGLMLSDDDLATIDTAVATLAAAGITPKDDVENADIEDAVCDNIELFRRRPLTTLLASCMPNDELIFRRVYLDDNDIERATMHDLVDFLDEVAVAAETDHELRDVIVFPDAEDNSAGTLRFRMGEWDMHDVSFDLDEDFDDVDAEYGILAGITAPSQIAHTFEEAFHASPITVWLDEHSTHAEALVEAIQAELR